MYSLHDASRFFGIYDLKWHFINITNIHLKNILGGFGRFSKIIKCSQLF